MADKKKLARLRKEPASELLFYVEKILVRNYYKLLRSRPSSEPFISGDTFKNLSTKEYKGGRCYISQPKIIFARTELIDEFYYYIDSVSCPFILITHHSDNRVDERYEALANNKYLFFWYAQNSTLRHPKVIPIPIGLEDRWRHNNGIIQEFVKLRMIKYKKIPRILFSFNVNTNPAMRKPAFEILQSLRITDYFRGNSRSYRENLCKYMFVTSPEGNGIDCHRTWEALYLGVVPIVTNENFHSQFSDMPSLIVDDWSDLQYWNEGDLEKKYHTEMKKIDRCEYLWSDYWKREIQCRFGQLR